MVGELRAYKPDPWQKMERKKRKKKVVHIYNGILLSHKKELNNAI